MALPSVRAEGTLSIWAALILLLFHSRGALVRRTSNQVLIYFIALTMMIPQTAFAGIGSFFSSAEQVTVKTLSVGMPAGTAENLGLKTAALSLSSEGSLVLRFLDKDGELVREFQIAKSSAEVLAESKPSNILVQMGKLRASQGHKGAGQFATTSLKAIGKITAAQLMRFPIEAFTFFLALGAVSTQDLIFNYSSNPLAYDQLLNGQMDPINQLGFAAFMVTNGLTTQALSSVVKSQNLHAFIPFLGMTTGFTASRIVSEFGNLPGLQDCAKHGKPADCDKAYQAFINFNYPKMGLSMAPSLVSMLASTLLLGLTKSVGTSLTLAAAGAATDFIVKKAAGTLTGKAIKIVGLKILLSFNEVGVTVNLLLWGEQIAELAGFLDTSSWIEVPLTHMWNNAVTVGPDVNTTGLQIYQLLKDNKLDAIPDALQKFSQVMDSWRENNSMNALSAHNQWVNFLSQLSAQYDYAMRFYSDMIGDVWHYKYKQDSQGIKPTDILRLYPLYGVKLPSGADVPVNRYLGAQKDVEDDQVQTLHNVSALMDKYMTSWLDTVSPEEKQLFIEMRNDFASSDMVVLGRGLDILNMLTWHHQHPTSSSDDPVGPHSPRCIAKRLQAANVYSNNLMYDGIGAPSYSGLSPDMEQVLDYIVDHKVGHATPFLQPGEGYLHALAAEYEKQEGLINLFPKEFIGANTPTGPEYLLTSMLFGPQPDGKNSLVHTTFTGFRNSFIPPSVMGRELPEPTAVMRDLDQSDSNKTSSCDSDIYHLVVQDVPVKAKDGGYANPIDIIQSNLVPTEVAGLAPAPPFVGPPAPDAAVNALGGDDSPKSAVDIWWTKNVETQYVNAWKDYAKKYQPIIDDLYKDMWQDYAEVTNNTTYSNGLIRSLDQEISFYFSILWRYAANPPGTVLADVPGFTKSANGRIAMESIYGPAVVGIQKTGRELEAQLKSIIVETPHQNPKATRKAIYYTKDVHHIPNATLDGFSDSIKQQITDLVNNMSKNPNNASPQIQAVLKTLQTNLISCYSKIATYGKIVNAVSYEERYASGTDSGASVVPLQSTGAVSGNQLQSWFRNSNMTTPPPTTIPTNPNGQN